MKFKTGVSIFTVIVISLAIILIVVAISQKQTPEEEVQEGPINLLDRLKGIVQKPQEEPQVELKREDIDFKPFVEGNYAYDERTPDFRFVCTNPCPVSEDILDQEFAAFSYAVSTLRGITQSDLEPFVLPFEAHASEDSVCPRISGALAYANTFKDDNGHTRGITCFFFDELAYDRSKFPYSTSIHEINHLFEFGKFEFNLAIFEGLSEMMDSFFVKGSDRDSFCWKNNNWYGEIVNRPNDPHGTGRQLFFELCNQYGFDYDDLPALFGEADKKEGPLTTREFVQTINKIVGTDTSHLFRDAGISF